MKDKRYVCKYCSQKCKWFGEDNAITNVHQQCVMLNKYLLSMHFWVCAIVWKLLPVSYLKAAKRKKK